MHRRTVDRVHVALVFVVKPDIVKPGRAQINQLASWLSDPKQGFRALTRGLVIVLASPSTYHHHGRHGISGIYIYATY